MYIEPEGHSINIEQDTLTALRSNPLIRVLKYILRRLLAILMTIVIGVFLTVIVANHTGMLDKLVRNQINSKITILGNSNFQGDLTAERQRLESSAGLSLSFWPKHLIYTYKALKLDWGNVTDVRKFTTWIKASSGVVNETTDSREIILNRLPYTLLLSCTAYLLLALIGIPLALFLSQREGHWLDRVVGILTPLSSVPSWIIGVLLVLLFAVQLRWFPAANIFDIPRPNTVWGSILSGAYHLVLPVTAVVLSLIFQLVYTWRTYLLIYSSEDFITLAQAKGLKRSEIEHTYIFKPALPYMVTNLGLTLVGFWQMVCALEYFFQWPGVGKLFIDALPNFHSESMYNGEMGIVIGIIVIFAYLLGVIVLLLDFLYLIVDPRLRVESKEQSEALSGQQKREHWLESLKKLFRKPQKIVYPAAEIIQKSKNDTTPGERAAAFIHRMKQGAQTSCASLQHAIHEINKVKSASVGMVMAGLLVILSILILIFIPYNPVGKLWTQSNLLGNPTTAKLALPRWINLFRKNDLPSTIVLDDQNGTAVKTTTHPSADTDQVEIDFTFDYPYQDFPSDLALYLTPKYSEKRPFISAVWITPDGREIKFKNAGLTRDNTYAFAENIPANQLVMDNKQFKNWYSPAGSAISPSDSKVTPAYYLLFADPTSNTAKLMPGKYTLRVKGLFFEKDCNLDAKLVVFGLVEGWAGTDYLRRDLIVPLLWGLPFALLIGIAGSILTSIFSMILAAASAWKGGWIDYLVQRMTEANLIIPVIGISVLLFSYYNLSVWLIIGIIILSNTLGSFTKVMRAAFLQEKQAGYIEAAKSYGASDWRIITHYLVPRIIPVVLPQIVLLIPNFIFLEATLAIFNIFDTRYPTWGRILYSALRYGGLYGSQFWFLEPISLMLLTGLVFVLISFGLNRILTPHLQNG